MLDWRETIAERDTIPLGPVTGFITQSMLEGFLWLDNITRDLAAQLQDEGANSFVESWNDLMAVIISKSSRSLAGSERSEPRVERNRDSHSGRGCWRYSRPSLPGRIGLLQYARGSSPAKLPAPQGARAYLGKYVGVFMQSCT